MRRSWQRLFRPNIEYSFDKKIADRQVKLCGNLQKDVFANFIYLTKDIFHHLPRGYVIYLHGSCIYLHCINRFIALNYMWCNLDHVDRKTGEVNFYGGAFTNSAKENQACQIFEKGIQQLIKAMVHYYDHHQILPFEP